MPLPRVHLAILQPPGYVHAQGLIDPARYLRWQFRRLGAEVSLSKNRLRADAVNFVLGAHAGFDAEHLRRHACIIVNLEQLGQGGMAPNPAYLDLLARSAVVDYDARNVASYAADPADVPLISFVNAPYLAGPAPLPLEQRPIDLLFFGSMNPRRREWLSRIESTGLQVASFDSPVYGEERDSFIRQAKAVVNCHHYEASRFEQVRAFHCLSLGTPVISERTPATSAPAAYDDTVFWLDANQVEDFFQHQFATPAWYDEARASLARFARLDPIDEYADLMAFASGYQQAWRSAQDSSPWCPRAINLGSGKDYKPGWLNIDVLDRAEPDLLLDLGQPQQFPLEVTGTLGARVRLEPGSVDLFYANNVLEHVPDLPCLMGQVLQLLKTGGSFEIEVPYERAPTAWQDPTHLRALNENSWLYYTDWFWYLGWFEHRFEITESNWLDLQLQPCGQDQAAFMKVRLRKIETSLRERTLARTLRADFGGLPDDLPPPAALTAPFPAAALAG